MPLAKASLGGSRLALRWRLLRSQYSGLGTYGLIGANVTVWGLYSVAPPGTQNRQLSSFFGGRLGAAPSQPVGLRTWLPTKAFWERHFFASYHAAASRGRLESVPLCTFMHVDGSHLLFNMVTLFFFGRQLEQLLGMGRYLIFYFTSGTVAAGSQLAACSRREPFAQVVGASGGVYALLAYMTCLMPQHKVYLYMVLPVPMWLLMCGLVMADSFFIGPGEAHTGHIAGAGCGLSYYLLRFRGWR